MTSTFLFSCQEEWRGTNVRIYIEYLPLFPAGPPQSFSLFANPFIAKFGTTGRSWKEGTEERTKENNDGNDSQDLRFSEP